MVDTCIDFAESYQQYYSFDSTIEKVSSSNRIIIRILRAMYRRFILDPTFNGGKFFRLLKTLELADLGVESISKVNLDKNAKVLEVGSGNGVLLYKLEMLGFTNLIGIDPYLIRDKKRGSVKLLKSDLKGFKTIAKFDLIILHHSLEHIDAPLETLKQCRKMLNPFGIILIAIPVVNLAFSLYGVNWVGMDAPRHIHIFSTVSIKLLFEKANLSLINEYYNSDSKQFVVSNYYCKENKRPFTTSESSLAAKILTNISPLGRHYIRMASKLNEQGRGDQAVFYVR